MKTIADFKRRLEIGTKLKTIRYIKKDGEWVDSGSYPGAREVSIIQSKKFALKTFIERENCWDDSYADYPTKSEFSVINENTIAITCDFVKLVYEFV
ncbi:MAG: hypothetical protein E6R13_05755 [Spirochaetes bacterium]|nr:MAG: hypothetical protein E6R13_05755 [Spirochaetota bacterium]